MSAQVSAAPRRPHLIEPSEQHALDNVNTPEEYAAALGVLDPHAST